MTLGELAGFFNGEMLQPDAAHVQTSGWSPYELTDPTCDSSAALLARDERRRGSSLLVLRRARGLDNNRAPLPASLR